LLKGVWSNGPRHRVRRAGCSFGTRGHADRRRTESRRTRAGQMWAVEPWRFFEKVEWPDRPARLETCPRPRRVERKSLHRFAAGLGRVDGEVTSPSAGFCQGPEGSTPPTRGSPWLRIPLRARLPPKPAAAGSRLLRRSALTRFQRRPNPGPNVSPPLAALSDRLTTCHGIPAFFRRRVSGDERGFRRSNSQDGHRTAAGTHGGGTSRQSPRHGGVLGRHPRLCRYKHGTRLHNAPTWLAEAGRAERLEESSGEPVEKR